MIETSIQHSVMRIFQDRPWLCICQLNCIYRLCRSRSISVLLPEFAVYDQSDEVPVAVFAEESRPNVGYVELGWNVMDAD